MFNQENITIAQYRPYRCFELCGRKISAEYGDSGTITLDFTSNDDVEVLFEGVLYRTRYTAFKADDDLFFIHAALCDTPFHKGISMAYDAGGGFLTIINAKHGHIADAPRRVEHEVIFASVSGEGRLPAADRTVPHFTDYLVGKQVEYRYSEGFTVRHRYLSEHSMEWTITRERFYPQFANIPHVEYCDVIWLRDNALMFSWLETDSGTQGAFVLNTQHMRTGGAFFGVGPDGLPESYMMGAFAEVLDNGEMK